MLAEQNVPVIRWLVGSYVTSLDMHGISVTLVHADDRIAGLWDAAVHTPALTWGDSK